MADGDVTLADRSADLIGCYRMIRAHVEEVIVALRELAEGYQREGREHYYRVRDDCFNVVRRQLGRDAVAADYTPALAAMLIYLNRTGFNGLFRLNAGGGFNVPAGRYAKPRICDENTLRQAAGALDQPGVDLRHEAFDASVGDRADRGDFVYFDPPYAPLSATSDFTSYTADGFTLADQTRLRDLVFALAGRGCHVVLSNSTAPEVAELYDNAAARNLGLRALKVPARRAINSKASARGEILEYIVTNVAVDRVPPSEPTQDG
jgi:DNA adenine methylase